MPSSESTVCEALGHSSSIFDRFRSLSLWDTTGDESRSAALASGCRPRVHVDKFGGVIWRETNVNLVHLSLRWLVIEESPVLLIKEHVCLKINWLITDRRSTKFTRSLHTCIPFLDKRRLIVLINDEISPSYLSPTYIKVDYNSRSNQVKSRPIQSTCTCNSSSLLSIMWHIQQADESEVPAVLVHLQSNTSNRWVIVTVVVVLLCQESNDVCSLICLDIHGRDIWSNSISSLANRPCRGERASERNLLTSRLCFDCWKLLDRCLEQL